MFSSIPSSIFGINTMTIITISSLIVLLYISVKVITKSSINPVLGILVAAFSCISLGYIFMGNKLQIGGGNNNTQITNTTTDISKLEFPTGSFNS